jgi:hypothetical protein
MVIAAEVLAHAVAACSTFAATHAATATVVGISVGVAAGPATAGIAIVTIGAALTAIALIVGEVELLVVRHAVAVFVLVVAGLGPGSRRVAAERPALALASAEATDALIGVHQAKGP